MTLGLSEIKACASTYSECSRRWQGNPLYTIVSSNACCRNTPAWFWYSMFCSRFTLAEEVYLCCAFITTLLPDLHLEWETTFYLEGYNKSSRPSEKRRRKRVVGIFEDYFLAQLRHLTGLDPGHHLLGQKEHSWKPFNTTALQDRVSEYSLPFKTRMCLSISLFTSTSWGILWNPAGRKRDEEHILHEITKH